MSPSLGVRGRRAAAVLALALVGPLGGLAGAGPACAATVSAASAASGQRPDLAGAFVSQINGARTSAGRARLAYSSALTSVAAGWAAQMARTNVLAHNPRLATSVSGWHFLGENVGVGYSLASLEAAFWGSPGHRANMLDRDYTRLGVAVVAIGSKLWVVEDFELPSGARPPKSVSRPQHQATRPAATRVLPRTLPRTHAAAPARPRPHARSTRPTPLPTDALTQVCAAQAQRLYVARRTLKYGLDWAMVRQSLLNGRRTASADQTH